MSATTEILNDFIYPAIFERADQAFPEHKFKKYAGGWKSQTYLFAGDHRSRGDKTIISERSIGRISEWGGDNLSIWDYVQQRFNLDQQGALIKLAEMAEVPLPSNLSPEEIERLTELNKTAKIWEDANSFFIDCLSYELNPFAVTPRAKAVRDYLEGRGYTKYDIRLPGEEVKRDLYKMEFGFIPSYGDLVKHLIIRHKEDDVRKLIKLDSRIGEENLLTIPYRDTADRIRGFAFRTIGRTGTKYLYSTGLQRKDILFNLTATKRKKDIVIVESQIDAMLATARGMQDVVALGGSSFNADQAKEAIRRGAEKFTLALDNDDAGRKATLAAINVLSKFDKPVFVAEYPNGTKDADHLIITTGIDAFKEVVRNAKRDYFCLLDDAIDKILIPDEIPNDKQVSEIINAATAIAAPLSPIDRDIFINQFLVDVSVHPSLAGITLDALADAANSLKFDQDKAHQAISLKKLLQDATATLQKGDTMAALDLLVNEAREISSKKHGSDFADLLSPVTEEEIRNRLKKKPESLDTGYIIEKEEISIPAGAISIVAAPTSHGKTTFLINVGLRVTEKYPGKSFHLFSYEEDADSILINSLNTHIGETISRNNRRSIKDCLAESTDEYIDTDRRTLFKQKKESFFTDLISTGRYNVHYVDYDSDTLIDAIYYLHKQGNTGGIFIDYMQLLHKGDRGKNKYGSRPEELKQICLDLKDVAVSTGLPIVLGAQFNREVVNHLRVHSTKIGEAGDIERIANLILGFWNNEFPPLAADGEIAEINKHNMIRQHSLYVKVLKQRGGRVGMYGTLEYNGNAAKISNDLLTPPPAKPTIVF